MEGSTALIKTEGEKTDIEKGKDLVKERYNWWNFKPKRRHVFNALIGGKTMKEIMEECHVSRKGLNNTIKHPFFLEKLEDHLLNIFFSFQVGKMIALDEVFNYCWNIGLGKKESDGLSQNQALKHLVALMNIKENEAKIVNPKQYNIIMNILKSEGKIEKLKSLAKEFGFEGLRDEDERFQPNPGLDSGEGN